MFQERTKNQHATHHSSTTQHRTTQNSTKAQQNSTSSTRAKSRGFAAVLRGPVAVGVIETSTLARHAHTKAAVALVAGCAGRAEPVFGCTHAHVDTRANKNVRTYIQTQNSERQQNKKDKEKEKRK